MSFLLIENKPIQTLANTIKQKANITDNVSLYQLNEIVNNYTGSSGTDIPKVFINGLIPTTKDDVNAELVYISNSVTFKAYITIKCQGTSSMKYPKKNFTIKLFKDAEHTEKLKVNFNNWGEQNKFCLKANWIDISHARNIVSARLWGDIVKSRANYNNLPEELRTSPNQGAIDGFTIKVYNNGIYQGRYTWNIPKDAWMTNMDDKLDTHCILCGENYDGGCFRSLPMVDGTDWSDEIHDVCPDAIKARWNEVVGFILNSTDEEFKNNIDNYIDLESLLDYHLFGMSMCGLDSYGKNQLFLTYDGIKWYASMYDMDSTWGLYWNGETMVSYDYARDKFEDKIQDRQGNLLFERIETNFYEELLSRWEELKQGPLSYANIINKFERFTDIIPTELIKEDYASTTAGGNYSGIPSVSKNNIQQIRGFAVNRQLWTNDYLDELSPVERIPCTGLTISPTELVFVGSGTQTIIATPQPSNTTDKIKWTSNNENVATVVNGVVTAVSNGNAIISVSCGGYVVECSVEISGIEIPDVSETILYSLPMPTTFTGSNYIDTGVSPLATDTPFTIFIDWINTGENPFVDSKHVVAHCMTEASPYPGIILQYAQVGLVSGFRQGESFSSNSSWANIANEDLHEAKIIYRKDSEGNLTISRCYNNNGQIYSDTKQSTYVAVPQTLILGCYQTTLGTTGRYSKGIMNDCIVYNYALSDDEVRELLLS